ncbi:MAG: transcriptional regulator [Candidatus Heimdallarchaeota archaeon]
MANHNPLLLILAIVPIIIFIILSEHRNANKRYKINKNRIESNYLQFFTEEGLQTLKLTDTDDITIESHKKEEQLSSDYVEISPDLLKFKFLMNPVRLGVIGLLYKYSDYQQADIRKALDISWGQFSAHIMALEKEGYISITNQFIDNKAVKMLFLTERGRIKFRDLRRILKSIVHN